MNSFQNSIKCTVNKDIVNSSNTKKIEKIFFSEIRGDGIF